MGGMAGRERYGAGRIVVADHDPAWAAMFERERARVQEALGPIVVTVEHVGSTAVPGLAAKPIIDLLVGMREPVEAGVGEGERLDVRKTYKLYIGGKFPRTESGRSYLVSDHKGRPWANACRGSRKDVRDAVQAARKAVPGWSGATAYNRGQVLYRVAEMLEGRRDQFVDEVARAEGATRRAATEAVDKA